MKRFSFLLNVVTVLIIVFPAAGQDKSSQLKEYMKNISEQNDFHGSVLIAQEGDVILKQGYGYANHDWNIPNSIDTKFKIGSITKPFTAILTMQLVENNLLKLDDTISDYLVDYPSSTGKIITIHHLLTHTSGIPDYLRLPQFNEDSDSLRLSFEPEELIGIVKDIPLDFEPGTDFQYSNSGYIILGMIIESITGIPWESVVQEQILYPIGMYNTGYDMDGTVTNHRANGYNEIDDGYKNAPYVDISLFGSAGGLYSTIEDLFLLDQALYTDKLLSKKYRDIMFQSHLTTPSGNGQGYGWDIVINPLRFIGHMGDASGFMCVIARMKDDKNTIIVLSNVHETNLRVLVKEIYDILYST
ncbi:serine hydrolase domain-containing protein [Candidatus Neomarinimicrobiota bacterium]